MDQSADRARTPKRVIAGALVTAALLALAILGYTSGTSIAGYYYCMPYGYQYCPPEPPPPPPHDAQHFLHYQLQLPEEQGETVTLVDQFGTRQLRLEEPEWIMNPTEKRRAGRPAEPILRPDEHFVCYDLPNIQSPAITVRVSNQFIQNSTLQVTNALAMCAPAKKSLSGPPPGPPPIANHYLCYDVVGETPKIQSETLTVVDQFGTRTIRIDAARELCNPVEKRRVGRPAEPILHPDEHLVCYRITSVSPALTARTVHTSDQFGLRQMRVERNFSGVSTLRRLCVPSDKTRLP